ncbi:MAG: LysM peptidoglycan-binding domain-containing protein [Chthoniobacterales bacterium]
MTAAQKLIVVLLAAGIAAGGYYSARLVFQPRGVRTDIAWKAYVHPNVAKLKKAQELSAKGDLPEARTALIEALTSAPRSPVTLQLRDLLGEVNTRLFFEKEPSPRKVEYTVARGDALSSIARKLCSSTDAIMRVNDLDSTRIRPGEKLLVPKIDFTITIDLPRERVVVHDGHGFFTQYPIAATDLPTTRAGGNMQTKVKAKVLLEDGRPLARASGHTNPDADKAIYLERRGYVLYGVEETSESTDAQMEVSEDDQAADKTMRGIAILKEDLADLDFFVRAGTPVTIIPERK